jgi:MarR-like DNA-binding transcriptional regulator SgrR of sgrS sRNA
MDRKDRDNDDNEHNKHQQQQQQSQAQQQAEPRQQRRQGWQHLVAGGVAGSSAVLLLHPFDVIKTRLQVTEVHITHYGVKSTSIAWLGWA